VEITIRRSAQSRRLASFPVELNMATKLNHRVPPPILWAQNPCFLEVTRRVALQNIDNNEVPCKIFQAKELRAVSASAGSFRLTDGAKRTPRTMSEGRLLGSLCNEVGKLSAKAYRPDGRRLRGMGFVESPVPKCVGRGALGITKELIYISILL
jgi:hypothetical protein